MNNVNILGYEEYLTEQGDTFDLIAWKLYDEEMLASEIIQANLDYADVLIFDAGVTLLVPVIEETDVQESVPPWRQSNESDL